MGLFRSPLAEPLLTFLPWLRVLVVPATFLTGEKMDPVSAYSVDWLTLAQQHEPGTVPDVGDGWVMRVDPDGSIDWVSARSLGQEDSHGHSIQVRSHGGKVEWSGNPSRWGRLDNVFGCTFPQALAVVNDCMRSLGLPPFTADPLAGRSPDGSDLGTRYGEAAVVPTGAILRRIDVARNFRTGENVSTLVRALAQGSWHGKVGHMGGPASCSWGSRRSRYFKCYSKGAELRSHKAPQIACEQSYADALDYRERLAAWCDSVGLLRWEMQLGREGLRSNGLRHLRGFDMGAVVNLAESGRKKIWPEVGLGGLSDVARYLESLDVSPKAAQVCQGLAYQWAAGEDVFSALQASYSQATAYRYRKLLKGCGIDVRHPPKDVTSLHVQPRVVDLVPAAPPSWYRRPERAANVA